MTDVVGYVAMLAVGVSLGLIGGGGSILTVPILVFLFKESPVVATGYSLFIVGIASILGAIRYHLQGLIHYRAGIIFAIPAFIGAFVARRFVVSAIPDVLWTSSSGWELTRGSLIMAVFGVIMISASVSMIRPSKKPAHADNPPARFNYPLIGLEGFFVGALTGFVGAGGGFLVIPALVLLAQIPMKQAIGTSLLIIAAKSLVGFIGDLAAGATIAWPFLLSATAIASFGIFGGTYLSRFVTADKLKPAFGWFVLVMGLFVIGQQLFA